MPKLEQEINSMLEAKFKGKGFKISNLKSEYDIVTPLADMVKGKRLVLADKRTTYCNFNFGENTEDEKNAHKLVYTIISERLEPKET